MSTQYRWVQSCAHLQTRVFIFISATRYHLACHATSPTRPTCCYDDTHIHTVHRKVESLLADSVAASKYLITFSNFYPRDIYTHNGKCFFAGPPFNDDNILKPLTHTHTHTYILCLQTLIQFILNIVCK